MGVGEYKREGGVGEYKGEGGVGEYEGEGGGVVGYKGEWGGGA